MSNKVIVHNEFEKAAKKLTKRYRSFRQDLQRLISELKVDSQIGAPLGRNLRKIRLSIKSKGAGKSGGARVITYVRLAEDTVYLMTAYDKSDIENIPDSDLKFLVEEIEKETG